MSLDYKTTGSCYFIWLAALHKSEAYKHLMNNEDRENMKWLKVFNKYDLYSKSKVRINVEEVKPYYLSLINKVCIFKFHIYKQTSVHALTGGFYWCLMFAVFSGQAKMVKNYKQKAFY